MNISTTGAMVRRLQQLMGQCADDERNCRPLRCIPPKVFVERKAEDVVCEVRVGTWANMT